MPKNLPPPQEKSDIGAAQQTDIDAKAVKEQVLSAINEFKVNPMTLINLGQMAEQAIGNKALYPMVQDAAISNGLADKEDFKPGIDYQMLAVFATVARMTKQMLESGELRG